MTRSRARAGMVECAALRPPMPIPALLLPVVVFLTGACVLVVEVLAVRVLSPYYGNTVFTVSSVISVVLLALSVGYYVGGGIADQIGRAHV